MRSLVLLFLLLPLSAHATLQNALKRGTRGTYLVEAKDAQGAWKEAGRLKYDFHYQSQALRLPAASMPSGELRVTAINNDENQLDAVHLSQAGARLKLQSAHEVGSTEGLLRKLASADRDVKEVGRSTVLLNFQAPKAGSELSFTLDARSAKRHELLGYPFWVRDKAGDMQVSYKLAAEEGKELSVNSGLLKPSSGHPTAPILGHFKVQDGRLKGVVDFGPDNDPGKDDFVTLLLRDAKGDPHEFKVGTEAKMGPWGRSAMVYGKAAKWQYMQFHFDVPLAELPRAADGGLDLELLAYGTACGPLDNDAKVNNISASASPASGQWITITTNVNENSGSYANVAHPISVTCVVLDPLGATVFSQTNSITLSPGNCGFTSTTFGLQVDCPGTYLLYGNAVSNPDYNSLNGGHSGSMTVGGVCSTATVTPTFTVTPTLTETPSSTATITVSPSWTATPSITATVLAAQQTQTAIASHWTPTFAPISSAPELGVKMGPVPVQRGQALRLAFDSPVGACAVELYTTAGDRVLSSDFGASNAPGVLTDKLAPGLYYARITADGKQTWQKIVILP